MDVTGSFFNKLRTLAVTLEKQAEQLKQVFHGDGTELEDDSPMRYLHELHSDVRTLKGDADNTLFKSSSERDTTYDFIKASKVLIKRNATNLAEIRELFQRYGYKPVVSKDTAKDEAEINPTSAAFEHEEPKDLVCPGTSSGPYSPLQIPQLSDFGLSKYALPKCAGTMHVESQACAQKEEPRGNSSGCLSPKAENFHIHGRDLCLNDETTSLMEDQTIFLLNNAKNIRQGKTFSGSMVISAANKNLDTPKQTKRLCDYMASPAAPEFCTPGVKIPNRNKIVLSKSSESNHFDVSDHVTGRPSTDSLALQTRSKKTTVASNNCLECIEEPCPPAVSGYTNIFSTPPPPPEITVIPDQIVQILSKYNPKTGATRFVEKQANEEIVTRTEKTTVRDVGNKENWKYSG